ncbi:MAG: glycosyltransferase [Candidatus Kapaibacterium sp.]|nr:glycosyltransferase [Candidatus Kapabacteria bacterium]
MKVLHLNTTESSGSAISARRLSEQLIADGIDSKMLVLDKFLESKPWIIGYNEGNKSKLSKLTYIIQRNLIPSYYQLLYSPNKHFSSLYSMFDITKHPAYLEADIIHFHFIADFVDLPSFVKKNNKPIVWTIHDFNPISGGLHLPSDIKDNTRLGNLIKKNFNKKLKAYSNVENIALVAPSEYLRNEAEKSGIFGSKPVNLIHNGLDLNKFRPYPVNISREILNLPDNGRKKILFIADDLSLSNKGAEEFQKIYYLLGDTYDFIIAGKRSNVSGIEGDNIQNLGYIYSEELLPILYSAVDICLLLSKYETFSLVALESIACSTPVFAYDSHGPKEIILNDYNGYLFQFGEVNQICEAVEEYLNNEVKHQDFRKNCRKSAEKFDIRAIANYYNAIYNDIYK